jgi:acetyl-CoA C-acetyltransferase
VVEAFKQFRGTAAVQTDDPQYGLAHNVGGSGGGVTVHVFERASEVGS